MVLAVSFPLPLTDLGMVSDLILDIRHEGNCRELLGRIFLNRRERHVGGLLFYTLRYLCGPWNHFSHCATTRRDVADSARMAELEDGFFMRLLCCLIN